jgi:hypothetical protein
MQYCSNRPIFQPCRCSRAVRHHKTRRAGTSPVSLVAYHSEHNPRRPEHTGSILASTADNNPTTSCQVVGQRQPRRASPRRVSVCTASTYP